MKKILLIEDNDDIRSNTAEILELSNYKVVVAENGKTGVEKAILEKPDLIVCDIMMPVLDGFGVLHAVHKNHDIMNTPFIFLTAKTERNDFRKGMELGADDYITKPFDPTELLNAVDSRLKKLDLLKQELTPDMDGVKQLMKSSFGNDALSTMVSNSDTEKFKKKQTIYFEGNRPTRLYYILTGKVKTYHINDDGKMLTTDLYSAGDFFGYNALLEETAYKDTAEALELSELAVMTSDEFQELVYHNREVAQKFLKMLAKNISVKEQQLIGMAYNSLRKKVADALLLLQKKYDQLNGKPFSIDINRDNLAAIAGTATESLIRTLSDFKSEQIIDISEGSITIINQKKLEHMVN